MTFTELISTSSPSQRTQIMVAIIGDGYSPWTARSYLTGERTPKNNYRGRLRRHVERIFKVDIPADELFPVKR